MSPENNRNQQSKRVEQRAVKCQRNRDYAKSWDNSRFPWSPLV